MLVGEAGTGTDDGDPVGDPAPAERPVRCGGAPSEPCLTRDEFVEMLAVSIRLSAQARVSKSILLVELGRCARRHEADETRS